MAAGGGDVCVNYSDFIVQEEDRRVLPWDRFSHWITCFCVVTFDLELGQVIEVSQGRKLGPNVTEAGQDHEGLCQKTSREGRIWTSYPIDIYYSLMLKPGFHYTANATITTQKQSDYKVEQSSFTLIILF